MTDLVTVVSSFLGLSTLMLYSSYEFGEIYLSIIGFLLMITGGYLHLILRQQNVLTDQGSLLFAITNGIGLILASIGYVIYSIPSYPGFWEILSINTSEFILLNLGILVPVTLLSIKAKLLS